MAQLGVQTKADLAEKLKITRSAVAQWGEKVPVRRQYEIRELLRAQNASKSAAA